MQPAILSVSSPAESSPAEARRRAQAARRRAILCVLGAAATFAVAAAAVKGLGGTVPLMQVILFRNLLAIPVLLALSLAGARRSGRSLGALLATRQPWSHVQRIIYGLMGMFGSFYGYIHLPIATVTALGFTMPFFLAALSVPLLGERLDRGRLLAMTAGFAGVLIMLRPWEGVGETGLPLLPAAIVLMSSVGWAMAMITIRRMGESGESGTTIVLWFAFGAALFGAVAAVPGWMWPAPWQWALLLAVGVVSAFAQLLMTAAYRGGETTLIAPFEYSAIIWTTALGVLLWGEWPDRWSLLGFVVLVAAGLGMWWHNMRRDAAQGD